MPTCGTEHQSELGRRIRELAVGAGTEGPEAHRWDARDEHGAPLRAGLYWIRLTSGARHEARRVAILVGD